jgi:hypothetical protein
MAIDNPVDAFIALNESDARQRPAFLGIAPFFMKIIGLFAPADTEISNQIVTGVAEWLNRQASDNLSELVSEIAAELRLQSRAIESLVTADQRHSDFISDELPGLVHDALRRARETRSKERIRRLARIVVRAAVIGPVEDAADYAEEMMRIAVDLTARDLNVLVALQQSQGSIDSHGVVPREPVNEAWRDHPPRIPGMTENEIQSICGKLQSFGLATRIERNNSKLGPSEIPYALLHKGKDFLRYARERSEP